VLHTLEREQGEREREVSPVYSLFCSIVGTVISNPHIESAVALQLEFSHFNNPNKPIIYPSIQALLDVAADELQEDGEYGTIGRFHLVLNSLMFTFTL